MPESTPIAISVRNVTFGYTRHDTVLDHVGFDVPHGQSLAVLGYNGVGKTTLFRIITGLLRPRSGEAIVNADVIHGMRDVFMLSADGALAMQLSLRENISFRAKLFATRQDPSPIDLDQLDRLPLIEAFGLADRLDTKVGELSSGLRRRADIAVGLLFHPHLVMLDEPTNAVDPATRDLLIELSHQLSDSGRTLLTITHDLDYCWRIADRAILFDHGRIAIDRRIADFPDFDTFKAAMTIDEPHPAVSFGFNEERSHRS
ncbi:ATP-binding cassette domain-containing protein [uncultured Bifidobacterium sp.]|uniref:ATP-binding cassette domain-containing protein n=1 Tax=uncultured Bifidobacterium sp. TaxID=165187 RepID=UPI002599F3E2|nr:ABC transporter ATP-binding protein [uncultured Bifidobacterium sp.]